MTEQELITKPSECYDREDAGNAMAEQARADAEALEAVMEEHGYDVAAIVEKAYFKKKQ
jgi:hypothetical protein